jgi:acyl carrier protein
MSDVSPEACAAALELFIRANYQVGDDDPHFGRDVNLWEEGYVDSTGVVEVIAFLEERFHVTITEEMLFSPEFTSIAGIANLVANCEVTLPPSEWPTEEARTHESRARGILPLSSPQVAP